MSTQSKADFEWSVKLTGDGPSYGYVDVGIASQLKWGELLNDVLLFDYDQNAILYYSIKGSSCISIGSNDVHENLPERKIGDVIRFRFQPRRKKFVIYLVRIRNKNQLTESI